MSIIEDRITQVVQDNFTTGERATAIRVSAEVEEIIKELIEDIPDESDCHGCNLEGLKQQLRDKWL